MTPAPPGPRGGPAPSDSGIDRARALLARGEWTGALGLLEAEAGRSPGDATPWELLGIARSWLQDTEGAIQARERAFMLHREEGDDLASARMALELANDFFEGRGEPAIANGWFQRARRLLEGAPPCRERALLGIWDAYMALMGEDDPEGAAAHAAGAAELARTVGADDMEMLARALQGLALVTGGDVKEGLSLLDEAVAAVLGQEVTDPQWYYLACCCMIDACDRVRDFGRSLEWCGRLREFASRWGVQAFLTTCRVKFTGALLWRGEWERCADELEEASRELARHRPAGRPAARVRLAELRRRQGRLADADALLDEARGHPLEPLVAAALALDRGDPQGAAGLLDGVLDRVPTTAPTERAPVLELLVRARVAAGQAAGAGEAAHELEAIAGTLGTRALQAAALAARGAVAALDNDPVQARRLLEDALHLYQGAGAPYEAARVRLALVPVLGTLGNVQAAVTAAGAALASLERLGATLEVERAREVIEALTAPAAQPRKPRATHGPLTRRQHEILALVARGMTNREIASALFLSEHTVHRHVANILRRMEASSRPAAVARAWRDGIL